MFEFGDQRWFPRILRDAETAYLTAAYRFCPGLARQWAEKISTVLHRSEPVEILDLCSGSGGAMPQIIEDLLKWGYDVRASLTDLYPESEIRLRSEDRMAARACRCDAGAAQAGGRADDVLSISSLSSGCGPGHPPRTRSSAGGRSAFSSRDRERCLGLPRCWACLLRCLL